MELKTIIPFLIRAKKATYAGKGAESAASRPHSHDLQYQEEDLLYIDSYLGGSEFSGEEAVWKADIPLWSMNYVGRVTGEPFSGDFLKEALLHVPADNPFRGPELYREGEYVYRCEASGDFAWFQGYETICFRGRQIYELFFHGGRIK